LEVSFVDMSSPDAIEGAIRQNTGMLWMETPSNPLLKIVDIVGVAAIAKKRGLLTVADNTLASPYLQRPLKSGHSDIIGGIAVVSDPDLGERLGYLQNAVGAIAGPFDSFLALRGLKTLHLRMAQHCANAGRLATWLEGHESGTRFISGAHEPSAACTGQHDLDYARRVLERLHIFALAESLGGVESLIEHPACFCAARTAKGSRYFR
jgi:cystathionine gamma-lyase